MFSKCKGFLRPALKSQNLIRSKSFETSCQEITIPVPWGQIAGKWWGPTDKRPILTMHGWQDNCGSFNRLIPLLNKDVGFLAIDFPGHGYSSRIPSGLYCHFTNYIILVQHIVNYFQWSKVSLLGHSMGAMTSFIYSSLNPETVDFLICIDAAKPMISPNNVARIARIVEKFQKYERIGDQEPPSYDLDEIKRRLCAPNDNSIDFEHCHHIAERNIAPSKVRPGKYYFARDPRLKVGELLNWPQEESLEGAMRMKFPIFIGKAISGSYYELKQNFYEVLDALRETSVDCVYHRLEGKHHYHLNNPEVLAKLVTDFITKHNVEDRTEGGIKEEMQLQKCFC